MKGWTPWWWRGVPWRLFCMYLREARAPTDEGGDGEPARGRGFGEPPPPNVLKLVPATDDAPPLPGEAG